MLEWVFGNSNKKNREKDQRQRPSYDHAKEIASTGSSEQRRDIASYEDMDPEILYFLTSDENLDVRVELAKNDGVPLQADLILAKDIDEEVRSEIAYKISRLLPNLSDAENERLTEMSFNVLEILANDKLPQIRQIIAEEVKLLTDIPIKIIEHLAHDTEGLVAAPILEYSPLLSDKEIIQIIASGVQGGALAAIARRKGLIEPISKEIADTEDERAIAELLLNETASISEKTLDSIGLAAPNKPAWHRPLVERSNLSIKTIRRIANFVSAVLVESLIKRNNLEQGVEDELRQAVRKRVDSTSDQDIIDPQDEDRELAEDRAAKLHEAGELSEDLLLNAIDDGDLALIPHSLQLLSGLPINTVSKMLKGKSGKAIVSLTWKAGLSMEMAITIQRLIAQLPPKSIIGSSKNGKFPISPEDMEWYISYFGT